jgi:hypothetical protein
MRAKSRASLGSHDVPLQLAPSVLVRRRAIIGGCADAKQSFFAAHGRLKIADRRRTRPVAGANHLCKSSIMICIENRLKTCRRFLTRLIVAEIIWRNGHLSPDRCNFWCWLHRRRMVVGHIE